MLKAVLVHGHVVKESLKEKIREKLGMMEYVSREIYCEGGYILTICLSEPVIDRLTDNIVEMIYDSERPEDRGPALVQNPIFVYEPFSPRTLSGLHVAFEFVGGLHGTEEDGETLYQA